jgi:hypothetical protein
VSTTLDHAAEHAATMYGRVELDRDARIVVGWVLVKAHIAEDGADYGDSGHLPDGPNSRKRPGH